MFDYRKAIKKLDGSGVDGRVCVGGTNYYLDPIAGEIGFRYSANTKHLIIDFWIESLICYCDKDETGICLSCRLDYGPVRTESRFFHWKTVWSIWDEPINLFSNL